MKTKDEKLSLNNIKDGALIEKFDKELEKILTNINDPNTGTKAREITIKVKLTPSKDTRQFVSIEGTCTSKSAPPLSVATTAYMGIGLGGVGEAHEILTGQMSLPSENVVDIGDKKTNG